MLLQGNRPSRPEISEKEIDVVRQTELTNKSLSVGVKRGWIVIIHQVHVDTMSLHQLERRSELQTVTFTIQYFNRYPMKKMYTY